MISIVIPLYNKEKSIYHTLQSVCEQTYTDFEVLVVNDGSTDNSASVAASYPDTRIRVIDKENGGVCSARNMGIKEAKGEYIALLDGDDQWDKQYLAEQVRMIADFPEAAMWGINFAEMFNGKLVRELPTGLPHGYRGYVENPDLGINSYFEMPSKQGRVSDLFCSSSVVIRKDVFAQVGFFDERLKYAEDIDMWWRIIAMYPVAFYDRYMVFYMFDSENRALLKKWTLRVYLPYYPEKFASYSQTNPLFYQWIQRWCAIKIKYYYFGNDKSQIQDARIASKKLDYKELPKKYTLFYKWPYYVARLLFRLDEIRRNRLVVQ